ncbi:MAG: F0F1 ATP synthase subunit B [Armatimonadota bacterium]
MQGTLLEFSYPTIIIQIINFFILLFFLNAFLYKPLKAAISQREKQVRDTLDEADSINAQAIKLKEEYESKMAGAKTEAAKVLQDAVNEAQKEKTEIVESGREDVRRINERAFAEIERERKRAQDELKAQIASAAVEVATKILKESMNEKTQCAIIDEFTRRVAR